MGARCDGLGELYLKKNQNDGRRSHSSDPSVSDEEFYNIIIDIDAQSLHIHF